jgi:hypothetical protein
MEPCRRSSEDDRAWAGQHEAGAASINAQGIAKHLGGGKPARSNSIAADRACNPADQAEKAVCRRM